MPGYRHSRVRRLVIQLINVIGCRCDGCRHFSCLLFRNQILQAVISNDSAVRFGNVENPIECMMIGEYDEFFVLLIGTKVL